LKPRHHLSVRDTLASRDLRTSGLAGLSLGGFIGFEIEK
jgi:hypothetical protein